MSENEINNSTPVQSETVSSIQAPVDFEVKAKTSNSGKIGMILGLISIVAWIIPLFGLPITITGIVFSARGLGTNQRGMAIAGLILSILFLIITLINSFLGALLAINRVS